MCTPIRNANQAAKQKHDFFDPDPSNEIRNGLFACRLFENATAG
jgi:hypothetical protein